MTGIGEVPCVTCGGTRQVVTRGPIREVDGNEMWFKVDLEPCPDCGNDDPGDTPEGAA